MQNTSTQKGHITYKCSFSTLQDLAHTSILANTMHILNASVGFYCFSFETSIFLKTMWIDLVTIQSKCSQVCRLKNFSCQPKQSELDAFGLCSLGISHEKRHDVTFLLFRLNPMTLPQQFHRIAPAFPFNSYENEL